LVGWSQGKVSLEPKKKKNNSKKSNWNISLIASIKKARPDLLTAVAAREGDEIPDRPPGDEQRQVAHIEGIGQPTTPGFFTLSNVDPTNW